MSGRADDRPGRPFWLRDSPKRDDAAVRVWKEMQDARCEACGWEPPAALEVPGCTPIADVLHAHHVRPVSCGGPDAAWNLVLLCPTCHALAHRMTLVRKDADGQTIHLGPDHRDELLELFETLRDRPGEMAEHAKSRYALLQYMLKTARERRRARLLVRQRQDARRRALQVLGMGIVPAADTAGGRNA